MSDPGRDAKPDDRRAADDASAAEPSFSETFAAAARKSALGHVAPGEAPTGRALLGAMGGIRGLVESILPGVGFLVAFTLAKALGAPSDSQVPLSVLPPAVIAVAFVIVRLVQRQPVTMAVAGVFGLLISAILAIITGSVVKSFIPGFIIDATLALVMLISLVVRRPFIGVLAGILTGDHESWRSDKRQRRVAVIATLLWAAFPLARLLVQVPLFLANLPTILGTTKLIMGVPLYAGVVWVTWLMIRAVLGSRDDDGSDDSGASASAAPLDRV